MAERAPPAAAADEEQAHAAAAPQQHHGKVPLHRVALHVTGQPRAPHHPNGSSISTSSNGMPFVVPMNMYKENRLKLCERLRAKVRGRARSSDRTDCCVFVTTNTHPNPLNRALRPRAWC